MHKCNFMGSVGIYGTYAILIECRVHQFCNTFGHFGLIEIVEKSFTPALHPAVCITKLTNYQPKYQLWPFEVGSTLKLPFPLSIGDTQPL